MKLTDTYMAGAAVVLLGLVWLLQKGSAQKLTAAAVGAAGDAVAGAAIGAGSLIGLPQVDAAKGAAAVSSGNLWDASLYLSATDFLTSAPQTIVNAANNPSINPLQPLGAWVGGTIYDIFHPAP